jgi:hypothetical protein
LLDQETLTKKLLEAKEKEKKKDRVSFMGNHDGVPHHWVLNRHLIDGRLYVKTLRQTFMEGIKV